MILIVTHTQDYTVDYVANILNKQQLPFLRLNTDRHHEYEYKISFHDNFCINVNGINSFIGLWFRRLKFAELKTTDSHIASFVKLDYDTLLFNLLSIYSFQQCLSNPYNIYKAENKIYQLKKAAEIGFNIPKTLLTNSFAEVSRFLDVYSSIIKPIRTGIISNESGNYHIFTSNVKKKDLEGKDLTPCIFQEKIQKAYEVRVTIVHLTVFAFKIDSQADPDTSLDWRKKPLTPIPITLPEEIEVKCLELVKIMGLKFGAIDLIVTRDGKYIFLEINPNGQWAWLELETGVPISSAIINYLYYGL